MLQGLKKRQKSVGEVRAPRKSRDAAARRVTKVRAAKEVKPSGEEEGTPQMYPIAASH